MPTISVKRELLFSALGKRYTDEEFEDLCFDFGIELDDVTTEQQEKDKMKGVQTSSSTAHDEEVIYKIEIPANRYDLLCLEGLSTALRVFGKAQQPPVFKTSPPTITINVEKSTKEIRPFVVCAVLRDITFNEASMKSFIDLQEKLHQNICRQRSLVSIGTHDLDTIKAPFSYKAISPKEIKFAPLNRSEVVDGEQLMVLLESDLHLKPFLPLIRDSPIYPVIYDQNDVVLSLPPIINGNHSKISLNTKNVFIEVTATDRTKAEIVLNIMCTMFVQYCQNNSTVEQVNVKYSDDDVQVFPQLDARNMQVDAKYINSVLGLSLSPDQIAEHLNKMLLKANPSEGSLLQLSIPPTRSDVLHACDVVEDVAIAYGYNNLDIVVPKTSCFGQEQPLNTLSDLLRVELASAGYLEALSLILGSHQDNFVSMRRTEAAQNAVRISNANASEFELARTSLLPGLVKTIVSNRDLPLPFKLFEVSDVVVKDNTTDVGARNKRFLCAIYSDKTTGFENIHGLLDFVMQKLSVDQSRYYLDGSDFTDGAYFPGCAAHIVVDEKRVGVIGMIHPEVLSNFELGFPCSALELDIHHFV